MENFSEVTTSFCKRIMALRKVIDSECNHMVQKNKLEKKSEGSCWQTSIILTFLRSWNCQY
jgi:hypothetical protein